MVLGIRYLTGYSVARDLTRQEAEWPPHPARVFMAMAATHFETGADPMERMALLWLESQPPPNLFASPGRPRSFVETYVPVNDQSGGILKRPRQPRSFPAIRPDIDSVYLFWNGEPETSIRIALAQLCAKVTRIGHSSSLAQMWIPDPAAVPSPNWQPSDTDAQRQLRVPGAGMLRYLQDAFKGKAIEEYFRLSEQLAGAEGKAKVQVKELIKVKFGTGAPEVTRPIVSRWNGYRDQHSASRTEKVKALPCPFDPNFIVLTKFKGRTLGLESTLQLTLALRNALLTCCPQPQPEWLTGHAPDSTPSKHPHLAIFPLPFVGGPHADGHIMGLGIAIPENLFGETRRREQSLRECIGPLFFTPLTGTPRKVKLWRENTWEWHLERELREDPPLSLKPITWAGPARRWASVTPVVLHHFPNKGDSADVERILRAAFRSAHLPDPESIETGPASAHVGAGSVRDVPPFTEGTGLTRYSTHVVATFAQDVSGPILVGRGRFRGYGLFRPLRKQERV